MKLHGSTNWLVPYTGVNLNKLDFASIVPKSTSIFLYWQSSLPYGTHKSRWRGGYVPTCYCYYPPNIPGSLFKEGHLSAPPGRTFVRFAQTGVFAPFDEPEAGGIPSSPVLITPVRQKKYDAYQDTINRLWDAAARNLGAVEKVVIIGYSFPRTDTRARKLLTAALTARRGEIAVEIVAPDVNSVASRIGAQALRKAKAVKLYNMKFDEYIEVLASRIPVLMRKAAADFDEIGNWIKMNQALGKLAHKFPQGPFNAMRNQT